MQCAVASSWLTPRQCFSGTPSAACLPLHLVVTVVPTHAGLRPYADSFTRWKLPSQWSWLEILYQNVWWKMQLPFHNINVCHGKRSILPKAKKNGSVFLQGSCDLYLLQLSPQGRLSFKGYCRLSSGLTDSALIGGTAQLTEPQKWRQHLAYNSCVASCSCVNTASGENVNVSTFQNWFIFFKADSPANNFSAHFHFLRLSIHLK